MPTFPFPDLSPGVQTFFRIAYGILQLTNLLLYLPHARRFFVSERWNGYSRSCRGVDLVQNPFTLPLFMGAWIFCSLGIVLDRHTILCAFLNFIFCWYFFVRMRWKSVLRGSGAPGLMNYWLAGAVFLTEYTRRFAPGLYPLTLLVFQVDLALIIFTSGFYKFNAGFPQNEGMDYGLVNPEWGYWPEFYKKLPPGHWLFKVYNQMAWSGQIASAVLMLIPQTRYLGGALLILSFVVVQANIKLALLSVMMMLSGVLFFSPGTPAEEILLALWPYAHDYRPQSLLFFQAAFNGFLKIFLPAYLFMLPLIYGGLYYNFYARKTLPAFLQKPLELYANLFGMILWRVFSADLIDFYIQIYRAPSGNHGKRTLLSSWDKWNHFRFRHVAESITVTTLFTTLKYYPSNPKLFEERLLRYAHTLPCAPGEILIFEYIRVVKGKGRWEFQSAEEVLVDLVKNRIERILKVSDFKVSQTAKGSPVHEAAGPGSYKPAGS